MTGSSSNHALFRIVSQGFSQLGRRSRLTATNQSRGTVENLPSEQTLPELRNASLNNTHFLPAEDQLMALLETFFATVGAVIPCVDKSTLLGFWREHFRDPSKIISRTAYALVNILVAHASVAVPHGEHMLFYHRSSKILDMHTLQKTDIEIGRLPFTFPNLSFWSHTDNIGSPNSLTYFNFSTKPPAVYRELDDTQSGRQSCFSVRASLASVL